MLIISYSDRCPACKNFQREWLKIQDSAEGLNLTIHFAEVDVDIQNELALRFLINALPTIAYSIDGKFFIYKSIRNHDSIMNFLSLKPQNDIVEIPWYRAPDSFGMHYMALFASYVLKFQGYYNKIAEKSDYPGWLILFVLVLLCIAVGTMISLIIAHVLIILQFRLLDACFSVTQNLAKQRVQKSLYQMIKAISNNRKQHTL